MVVDGLRIGRLLPSKRPETPGASPIEVKTQSRAAILQLLSRDIAALLGRQVLFQRFEKVLNERNGRAQRLLGVAVVHRHHHPN